MVVGSMIAMAKDGDASAADPKAKVQQTTCPVMGGKIDKNLYVDVEGKRIYICCKGCEGAIKKDPAKYIKKLEAAGVTVEDVPTGTNAVKAADATSSAK
jgi:hypothetical protein